MKRKYVSYVTYWKTVHRRELSVRNNIKNAYRDIRSRRNTAYYYKVKQRTLALTERED